MESLKKMNTISQYSFVCHNLTPNKNTITDVNTRVKEKWQISMIRSALICLPVVALCYSRL